MRAQAHRQIAVEFDHGEAAQALHQRLRERGQTGADLHHGVAGLRRDGVDDGVDDGAIGQEVLTEALAGDVLHAQAALNGPPHHNCGASRYST